ncbi:MAG: outer membrane lipoprotein carrier protein LolA [Phycisphaerae bacterium]|nr:outer membrane lipoprotein carrier protein LolA [Phycisphaerae bacterium]
MHLKPQPLWILLAGIFLQIVLTSAIAAEREAQADPQVIDWLDRLEARGKHIRSFEANITYKKENTLLASREIRMGDVAYLAAGPEAQPPARFAIRFRQLVVDDALRQDVRDFIFDGRWLVEKDHAKRLFLKREVVGPGQKFNPLQVDGPFPLPLGQKRRDVLARFQVKLVEGETDQDPPPLHLRLTPRPNVPRVEGHKRFKQIDLWFDRETLLPVRVVAQESANVQTTVKLAGARTNHLSKTETADRFTTRAPAEGQNWRVEVTPWKK